MKSVKFLIKVKVKLRNFESRIKILANLWCAKCQKFFEYIHKGDITKMKDILSDDNIEICKIILQSSQDSVLHIAIRAEDCCMLEWLMHNGFEIFLEHQNDDGKRPLHEAALIDNLNLINILLKKGVEIDPLKRADWTPLMLATAKGHLRIIKTLIDAGASCTLFNKDGWTPFHIACRNGDVKIVEYFLFLNNNIWNSKSKNERTPLHTAALHGNTNIVKLLLERANYCIDEADSCGNTPLMDAVRSGHLSCVHLLLVHNSCSLNKMDNLGRLTIHLAAEAGQNIIIKSLINDYHVDVNSFTKAGEIPLHFASRENQSSTIGLLLSLGSSINHKNSKGRTALWMAASSKKLECYNLLLQNGAEDIPDANGIRPSDLN